MGFSETQNLTVVLRVRPPNEFSGGRDRIVHVLDGQMVILTDPRDEDDILRAKRSREKRYMFDLAFDSWSSQLDVYLATTKPLIGPVLDGFNATVFAYGPTGTGKTYTMLGTGDNPGIMALALNEIFAQIRKGQDHNSFTVTMSYLEVYNELIRDLLAPDSGDLELREDSSGVTVAGLSEVEAQTTGEVMGMLRDGNVRRTTEPTSVNKTSSRSHAVLQVTVKRLKRVRSLTETVSTGKLYMIDLAGSERATHTKNRGTRLVEGAHINRSLLALGNCIKALSNNSSAYVNYRDSKLTRLLKDSLGGNCRTVMIAHVAPDQVVFDESRNTLQYADRAKRIRTKVRPNLQTVNHHIAKYPIIVEELHKEIARLKKHNSGQNGDSLSIDSTSAINPMKDRELLESKRAELIRIYEKQLKFKMRLSKVESSQQVCGVRAGQLQQVLDGRGLYSALPPVSAEEEQHIDDTESELRGALRKVSARRRKDDSTHKKLLESWGRLTDRHQSLQEQVDDKVLDEDYREILTLLSATHSLQLNLAGARAQTKGLQQVTRDQSSWLRMQHQWQTDLLEIVRHQHQLLQTNNIALTPELQKLYRGLKEGRIEQYEVLPRINSAASTSDWESPPVTPPPPTPPRDITPTHDTTPVFMKTYNVSGKDGVRMERDVSQTTIHILSTPSLTGVQESEGGMGASGSPKDSAISLIKGSSSSDMVPLAPNTGNSVTSVGKQAQKAMQLQRLRSLRTEPVLTPANNKQKHRGRNVNAKTFSKNTNIHGKSETHVKLAEKARIYGGLGSTRTPQTRGRRPANPQGKPSNAPHLTVAGSNANKNFTAKVFR